MAHVLRDQGRQAEALSVSEEAVALARQDDDPSLLAHTVRHVGDLHRESGRPAEAMQCYEEALSRYRGATDPNPADFANALRATALLKRDLGETEAADRLMTEARRHYEAAGLTDLPED